MSTKRLLKERDEYRRYAACLNHLAGLANCSPELIIEHGKRILAAAKFKNQHLEVFLRGYLNGMACTARAKQTK